MENFIFYAVWKIRMVHDTVQMAFSNIKRFSEKNVQN